MKKWTRANYLPGIPLYGSTRITASQKHIELSKKAALDGMVLLKNEGSVLPLCAGSRIALFGKGTFDYVKGGGGSGDVNVPYIRTLYDGFLQHKDLVVVDENIASFYRNYVQAEYRQGGIPGMIPEPELPDPLAAAAAMSNDAAIVSISRFSGEGWDRKSEFGHPDANLCDNKGLISLQDQLFPDSDFYLSPTEEKMIQTVTAHFSCVILVLNVGGMIATDWFADNSRIQGALLAWQGGMEGGCAAADLLLGLETPSGKLSDTFARRLEDYPSTQSFHESSDYVNYTEDIYVGYRYFETLPGAAEKVIYPFGFGLSYTTFSLTCLPIAYLPANTPSGQASASSSVDGSYSVRVSAVVTNTGSRKGREVVQLYCEAPQGLLGKPARVLCGYQKTRLLFPGESQQITLQVAPKDIASYDDSGQICKSAWVLERGIYHFFLGTDVRCTRELEPAFRLSSDYILQQCHSLMAPSQLPFRLRSDGSCEKLFTSKPHDPNENCLAPMPHSETNSRTPLTRFRPSGYESWVKEKDPVPKLADVYDGRISLQDFIHSIPDADLISLLGGQPNTGIANTCGYGNLPEFGIPNIMTADGPAGLRVHPDTGVTATAFPCSTLLACTWDPDITFEVGRACAEEVKENNIGVWLAPGVNIHRSPLCGRNFEYYSEDPFLTGKQAEGMVKGIQSCRVAATVKHLALNDKETNRKDSDSRASERAIREIYLKQFEIILHDAHPWSIMSSYNIINGYRASENPDLLIGILRKEWGYDGMVTSDWWTYGEQYKECAAGNDVKMACGFPDRMLEALHSGYVTRKQLETAAEHILTLILRVD